METTANLGFLTIIQENGSYLGGYLVANQWGRPLEFRLTSAVQPNKVQQILYGPSLKPYLCSDLLGKTLVEKTSTSVDAIITDCEPAIDLRHHLGIPVVWLRGDKSDATDEISPAREIACKHGTTLITHRQFPQDADTLQTLLAKTNGLDLAEPFSRIQEALAEARKLGAVSKAA